MKLTISSIILLASTAFADLNYEGSSTIADGILQEVSTKYTAVKFSKIDKNGSGKAVPAVVEGKASFGGLSRELKDDEKAKVQELVIGHDAIAVFVNAKNSIQDLTRDQIKGIFTGKITNWKEVGGKDAKIIVFSEFRNTLRATLKEFKEMALGGTDFGPIKEIETPLEILHACAQEENCITYASFGFRKEPGIAAIGVGGTKPNPPSIRTKKYPFARPLVLITKGAPSGEVKQFFDYMMSDEGQTIIGSKFISVK